MSTEFKVGDRILVDDQVGVVTSVDICTWDGVTQSILVNFRDSGGQPWAAPPARCKRLTEEEYVALVMGGV